MTLKMILPKKAFLTLISVVSHADAQASGSGTTTRYWDCCKASCGWPLKATLATGSNPVTSCNINNKPLTDYNAVSGCNSGVSYMCSSQTPWAVSETFAYGFAATSIAGGTEATWCCACYELTFTSTSIAGKKMIVQSTNTGGDLGSNQFDLAVCMPVTVYVIISLIGTDARWWIWSIQRLYIRMGHSLDRLGSPIRRYFRAIPMRSLSLSSSSRMLLPMGLVRSSR